MSKDNPMQWSQTVPTISRLDYIATAIYAAWNAHPEHCIHPSEAVELAKEFIAELDKEQNHE